MQQSINNAPDSAKIQLAILLSHYGDNYEAQKLADELPTEYQDRYMSSSNVQGWVRLSSKSEALLLESEKFFQDPSLEGTKQDLDSLLGRAKYLELISKPRQAIEVLNRAIVNYPDFHPALTEKCKLLIQIGKWEQVNETCQRVLEKVSSS